MAPVLANQNGVKPKKGLHQSSKPRIIGKIRGLTDTESESLSQSSKRWITVKKPEENGSAEKCTVSFESESSRKNVYELDYCYEEHEEIDELYSREIHAMVLEVFNGRNASIIVLGSRGSGKTYTIQGSEEKPGLAVLAMNEILSKAKELGKSVFVSFYELTQEQHVKDLLNPDHSAIQLLEDAQGQINIKGLSQVRVNSVAEFRDMCSTHARSQNTQNIPIDKGFMVHILSNDDKGKAKLANKVNFVDLAGYEDLRKSSRDGITPSGTNRKNKSLYALLNVVSAINANEMRVPYRESKLTRILQDSLGGTSHVLLLTCLKPSFCHESLRTISLVSQSCRSTKQVLTDSTNRSQCSAKVKEFSSLESARKMSASLSVKKQTADGRLASTKKANSILKTRKLFDEDKVNSKQLKYKSKKTSLQKSKALPSLSLVVPFSLEEAPQDKSVAECSMKDKSVAECSSSVEVELIEDVKLDESGSQSMPKLDNILFASEIKDEPTSMMKTDVSPQIGIQNIDTPAVDLGITCEENKSLLKNDKSPPLSSRIREICNDLKALCESTPSTINIPDSVVAPYNSEAGYSDTVEPPKTPSAVPYNSQIRSDILEPKTPAVELNSARLYTPQGTFSNHGSKIKDSLVKEYLNYLNSANKEQLKSLKGIGEKRSTYILQMREESPEPFKTLDDLQDIGVSAKQIKGMLKQVAGGLFD